MGVRRTTRDSNRALHRLTVRELLNAADGDHGDGGGLLLRKRGGAASWVFRFTSLTGRRREMGLGMAALGSSAQAGASLTGARKRAQEARAQLDAGTDPIDARERIREAAAQAEQAKKAEQVRERMTLARAARAYHERVIEPSRTAKHGAQWINSLEQHMPGSLWHAPIDTIAAPQLLDPMLDLQRRLPETAGRVRQRLDAVFEDATFRGWCGTNPAAAIKRKLREAMAARERGEFKALPYAQAPALIAQLRAVASIAARCLEFSVLTAARTSEALNAAWSEIDTEAALWVIPKERMKAGEPHTVHLSTRALQILAGQRGLDAVHVFPSPALDDRPLSNMAMLNTLGRLGMRERTTVHGLCRATFSTWAYETAAARPDVIEACLAHREADRVKAAYNRAQFHEERRALLNAWAEFLMRPPAANVVPLRAA